MSSRRRRSAQQALEELAAVGVAEEGGGGVGEGLQGRRYLKLLSQLQAWLKTPRFTAMGDDLLPAWRPELTQAVLAGLTTLPGWWANGPYDADAAADLHRLRRRIKRARY